MTKAPTRPTTSVGQWIHIGQHVSGYVFSVNGEGSLEVGYLQNGLKAIKETVVWTGEGWVFKYQGPCGSYLRGAEEALIKRGPYG